MKKINNPLINAVKFYKKEIAKNNKKIKEIKRFNTQLKALIKTFQEQLIKSKEL